MSLTTPSVSFPVLWSVFNTIETLEPGLTSALCVPLMLLIAPFLTAHRVDIVKLKAAHRLDGTGLSQDGSCLPQGTCRWDILCGGFYQTSLSCIHLPGRVVDLSLSWMYTRSGAQVELQAIAEERRAALVCGRPACAGHQHQERTIYE